MLERTLARTAHEGCPTPEPKICRGLCGRGSGARGVTPATCSRGTPDGGTRSIHGLWVSAPFGDARANRRASSETGRRVKLHSDGQAREVALGRSFGWSELICKTRNPCRSSACSPCSLSRSLSEEPRTDCCGPPACPPLAQCKRLRQHKHEVCQQLADKMRKRWRQKGVVETRTSYSQPPRPSLVEKRSPPNQPPRTGSCWP